MDKFDKIADIFLSIVLGYITSAVLGAGDVSILVLASIFWLIAIIHYRGSKQREQ